MSVLPQVRPSRGLGVGWWRRDSLKWAWYPLGVYLASRLLFFLIAVVDSLVKHQNLSLEMSQWDGYWYLNTTYNWYPHAYSVGVAQYSTIGFLPVYPGLMWIVWQVFSLPPFGSGLLISMLLGVSATLLVCRLAYEWWGETPMRRAAVFWSLWPGTIVFSMVYSEGVTVTVMAGAMLLMARKKWLWAGLLAGVAGGVAPIGLAAIPACAAAAFVEVRRVGWATHEDRRQLIRPLLMPVLSTWGAAGFGIFLWFWVGSPLASYKIQHGAWQNSTSPLAIVHRFETLVNEIGTFNPGVPGPHGINLNNIVAVVGAIFCLFALWRLWKWRDTVPVVAIVWSVCVSLLVLTSGQTPPNPRMLLCTFPLLLTVGAEATGRKRVVLLTITVLLTLVMSWFTYVGSWMLP